MSLTPKISFVSLDKTGQTLVLQDTTGAYSVDNAGGYGTPNPTSFKSAIISVGRFSSTLRSSVKFDSPTSITTGGQTIVLDSSVLGITKSGDPLQSFSEGVLEVLYQLVSNQSYVATGRVGDKYVTGSGLDALLAYNYVSISNVIYQIDKSLPNNGGTVLNLTTPIATAFSGMGIFPVYDANLKVLVQSGSDDFLVSNIGVMSGQTDDRARRKTILDLSKLFMWKFAAQIAFDSKDYLKADQLLNLVMEYGGANVSSC